MTPAVSPETARKRIQRGWSWEAATSAPAARRNPRTHRRDPEPPCLLNATLNAWRLPAGYLEPGVRGNMRVGL